MCVCVCVRAVLPNSCRLAVTGSVPLMFSAIQRYVPVSSLVTLNTVRILWTVVSLIGTGGGGGGGGGGGVSELGK